MFAKKIINSARFLTMPPTSRLLYYDLGMAADDEGVVEAYTVMRTDGSTEDDLKVLVSKGFIKVLNQELVSVITDWSVNNFIRNDRFHDSIYHELLVSMESGIPTVDQRYTEVRLGKDRLNSNSINRITAPCSDESEQEAFIKMPLIDPVGTYYYVLTEDVEHYKELYPAVDVEQELRNMVGWLEANPSNRKTKNGIKRFISNWLSKEQNRARAFNKKSGITLLEEE